MKVLINLISTQIKYSVKISNFSTYTNGCFKKIIFDFNTKLTIKGQLVRINITLPTKTRPIFNQEISVKISKCYKQM
jgi:hypothetical protein